MKKIQTKIDYNNSLACIACSIVKYFESNPLYKSHEYLDKLFSENHPNNIILLPYDGLGSRFLDKILKKMIKRKTRNIFSFSSNNCIKFKCSKIWIKSFRIRMAMMVLLFTFL